MTYYAFMGALEQGFAYGFLVLGVYLTFRVLDFPDLTVDGSLPLGAAVSAVAISAGIDPFTSLVLALAAGFLAGAVTGVLNTKFGILHLLASILTMIALYSINLRIMGRPNMTLLGKPTVLQPLLDAGIGMFNAAPLMFGIFSILALLFLLWLLHTAFGLAMQATGANNQMITSQGVNTDRVIILTVGLSNGLAAVSGALLCQAREPPTSTWGLVPSSPGWPPSSSVNPLRMSFHRPRTPGGAARLSCLPPGDSLALSLKLGRFSFTPSDLNLLTACLVVGALTLPKLRRKVLRR